MRESGWGYDMSQISSRLSEQSLTTLGSWAVLNPGSVESIGTRSADGHSYLRRLFGTDLLIIVSVSALPAIAFLQENLSAEHRLETLPYHVLAGLALSLAWILSLTVFKAHSIGSVAVGMQEYKVIVYGSVCLAGVLGVLISLLEADALRLYLSVSLPVGVICLLLSRWSWRQWLLRRSRHGFALSNVLIYGQGSDASFAIQQISKKSGPVFRVVGVLLDGTPDTQAELEISHTNPTVPLAYSFEDLEQDLLRLHADSVIVAGPLVGGNQSLQELSWRLEKTGTKLIVASSLTGVASRRVRTTPLDGMPLMHVDLAKFTGARYLLKRGFDILFASAALLALSPVFMVIALLIRREGPGKIFFRQERAGQDGKAFTMFKFRTMVEDAEARLADLKDLNEGSGPLFKLKNDPRITRTGHWLRKHSLDELPQFVNVLLGDMSVVGPRPPLFTEVQAYEGHTRRRLLLKPGVTGLWQVSGRSNLDWKESVRLDLYYAENWTVLSDLRIIWRTFHVMIKPEGAY